MGNIEEGAKVIRRTGQLQNAVLTALSVGGILALALVAPNAMRILELGGKKTNRFSERSRSSVNRLVRQGYIEFVEVHNQKSLRITKSGRKALERAENESRVRAGPRIPKKWDGRWRLVVFDIPERRKTTRNKLREMVRQFGFLRLQDSVWVHPYDCEDLIVLMKADLHVGKDILYAVVEKLENDRWIREHFDLAIEK